MKLPIDLQEDLPLMLQEARRVAAVGHYGHLYGDNQYLFHLEQVSEVLTRFGFSIENPKHSLRRSYRLQIAAYLHDLVDDTPVTLYTIQNKFGSWIGDLISATSEEKGVCRKDRKAKTYPKAREYGEDAVALLLAERIANIEFAKRQKHGMFYQYWKEHPMFTRKLRVEGELESMWDHLDSLMTP